jgi:hypothetical protein
MSGWKTKTAAGLSLIYGVVGIFLDLHDADTGMQFVVNGLGLLGLGHKIEKLGG